MIEEAHFLQSVPAFYLVELRELQRLCQHVRKRQLGYGQQFIRAGAVADQVDAPVLRVALAEHCLQVYVVENGAVDLRMFFDPGKKKAE